jgi:hypothetical protein
MPKSFASLFSSGNLTSNEKALYTSKETTAEVSFDVPSSVVSHDDGYIFSFVTKPMNQGKKEFIFNN